MRGELINVREARRRSKSSKINLTEKDLGLIKRKVDKNTLQIDAYERFSETISQQELDRDDIKFIKEDIEEIKSEILR